MPARRTSKTASEIRRRRTRAKIPMRCGTGRNGRLALDMLDEITGDQAGGGWGLPQRPVVADAGYGDATGFRLALESRGMSYVVAVKSTTSAYPGTATPQSRRITVAAARRCPATARRRATWKPWSSPPDAEQAGS